MLHSDDTAEACVALMELPGAEFDGLVAGDATPPQPPLINIGRGEDYTIEELANRVQEVVGFRGDIRWDAGKPDGAPRKLLDVNRMKAMGWPRASRWTMVSAAPTRTSSPASGRPLSAWERVE